MAIFYDKYLSARFSDNQRELKQFVSSLVYTSQIFYNRDNIRDFAYFKLLVVKFDKFPGETNATRNNTLVGNNMNLLGEFCAYQNSLKDRSKWDTAMLLTG